MASYLSSALSFLSNGGNPKSLVFRVKSRCMAHTYDVVNLTKVVYVPGTILLEQTDLPSQQMIALQ